MGGKEQTVSEGSPTSHSADWKSLKGALPPLALGTIALSTRLLFRGPLYFADGPGHIRSIVEKVYIIQPPGYWLFNRTAGLFPDPVLAISAMNIAFSVAGTLAFYFTALFFAGRRAAFVAALAYSSVFYLWFSGEVHSTYASQVFFPVAVFCMLLHYERDNRAWQLALAALLFALGAGFRPFDGVFLLPALLYYAFARLPGRRAALFLAGTFALCLTWIFPTLSAFSRSPGGLHAALAYAGTIATHKSIVSGLSLWLANLMRFFVPTVLAFWLILPVAVLNLARNWHDWRFRMLLIWIVPGSLFFILSYISDAPYLNFLTAAVLLLAVNAPRRMLVVALCNAVLFLAFRPIPSNRLSVNMWNCYAGHFTRYGIQHQWWPNLSSLQGSNRIIERP